jgi:vitamin B12 transporter
MLRRAVPLAVTLLAIPAQAVILQGKVTSPFGRPVPGARIQLIALSAGTHSVANAVSGLDGSYEIRTDLTGRFVLLTTSFSYAPQISPDFYGGRTNLLTRDVILDPAAITPRETTLPTGLDSSLAQATSRVTQIAADRLTTRAFLPNELPLAPATILNESGMIGQRAFLSFRGANPDANAVLLDGVPIQPLGRAFDFGIFSATGLAAIASTPAVELAPGPNPLYPLASEAGTVALATAHASSIHPAFVYSGDAGNLHSWRDEAAFSLTHTRTGFFAAFSRFDTSNALPAVLAPDRFHSVAAAANLGYNISAATSLRLTLREQLSAAPLPIPYDLGLTPNTKDSNQQIAGTFTFETRTSGGWHNLVRYGLVRAREQTFAYLNPLGRAITLTGANGYTVSGRAAPFPIPPRQDQASNRDEASFETDYPLTRFLTGLFTFRYENERALNAAAPIRESAGRTNLIFAAAFRGELKHRLFYEASGDLTHSSLLKFTGDPRVGLTYVPVLAGTRRLKGTSLHLTAATGQREPSLPEQAQSLDDTARARTLDASADQNLYRQKLILHAGYFHNQFSHQAEILSLNAPVVAGQQGIGPTLSRTQAFRTQGFASELRYQPRSRLLLTGGYTLLASLIERSAATAAFNPAFAAIPIGATTALTGQRPFRRPPQSGFFAIQYTGRSFAANLQGSLAGRADDSTFTTQTPALLLPNRNLDPGYARLDAGFSYAILRHATVFTQLTNLLNDQHIGPIGYPSAPFTFRSGLKIRLGRE